MIFHADDQPTTVIFHNLSHWRICHDDSSMPELSRNLARSWSSTLKLPKSTFPPRVSSTDHAKFLKRCTDDLYAWQRQHRDSGQSFVLHDGPPYANGELHVGHALNKILKDIICRVNLSSGKKIDFVPGWDCHGLPIELKALQQQEELERLRLSGSAGAAAVRKAARQLAERTITEQKAGFRKWAVMGDWDNSWKTMDKSFEKQQMDVFLKMVEKGLIYRRYKPVYWSPSSGTALAEAELEYKENHISTAALVKYPFANIPPRLQGILGPSSCDIYAVIWTTTPWTLPANAAIAVGPSLEYSVVQSETHGKLLIAKSRREYIQDLLKEHIEVLIDSVPGSELQSTSYHSLFKGAGQTNPIITADYVTADSGSGLVHSAPGHGMEDYETCLSHGIDVFAPVNGDGLFTVAAIPDDPGLLSGKFVLDEGNDAVLEYVQSRGQLLAKHRYEHKYPYDWRSKRPIIIRATEQWFADVGDIRDNALAALQDVTFIPNSGKARLESFVKNRSEWCISRQRAWGVPIPALYHRETGEAVLTKESVSHIMKVIEERGIDAWWTDADTDIAWIPPSLRSSFECLYKRGTDTMDVWFDSGSSWSQIVNATRTGGCRSDVYLEGTDQHRGWFQSSLLTSVAYQVAKGEPVPKAPFKALITHGFTLDQHARKMSKSIGNVVHPNEIMNGTLLPPLKLKKAKGQKEKPSGPVYDALGPDALRMWVAGSDYTKDVIIGMQVLKSVNSSLHKLRVTFKLLLGALQDFNPAMQLPYESLHKIDKIALLQLHNLIKTCQESYGSYEFHRAVTAINKWANLEFSAFYIESLKDRLYAESENSLSRRAAQTALNYIYLRLQELLAPFVPLLVEESWEHCPEPIKSKYEHPLKRVISNPPSEWKHDGLNESVPALMTVNSTVKTLQETARSNKQMGSSLQSFVHLSFQASAEDVLVFEQFGRELEDLFVVSSVTISYQGEAIPEEIQSAEWNHTAEFVLPSGKTGTAFVYTPQSPKCARCWRYAVPPSADSSEDSLCGRCEETIRELEGINEGS